MIIGYTTGVFDMFHIGHLNILKQAKENCDYLIVGVTIDSFVEKYKGTRPIIPFEQRKQIVEAIKYVDRVVPQIDHDKFKVHHEYQFHKMFVGDDWKGTSKWDEFERQFSPLGVQIVYLERTKGVSSGELRKIVKKV